MTEAKPFKGQTFAFFGEFSFWPSYHGGAPEDLAQRLGARLSGTLDAKVDCVVFGDLKGSGRSEAKKKAEKLLAAKQAAKAKKKKLTVLDEAAYRELVRVKLKGKRFAFAGGFDCSPEGLVDGGLLYKMVEAVGGKPTADVDEKLDYLVVGNRRGPSKVALQNRAKKLNESGAEIVFLDETGFLELVRVDKPKAKGAAMDFAGFVSQLYAKADEGKLGRALDMLRHDKFKLYLHANDERLVGVVRSQSGSGSVYAPWLTHDGRYGCSQQDLTDCMGLQGSTCKHLMVLVVGAARTGQLPIQKALEWMSLARGKAPKTDKELGAQTFIEYKGAEAGQLDWRPTETIPEDYYA